MSILITVLTVLHVILCLLLILLILLQSGKGSDVGSMLGGGASQTLFGPAGGKNIMVRITTVVAILILITTLVLAKLPKISGAGQNSIISELQKEAAGAPETKAGENVTAEAKAAPVKAEKKPAANVPSGLLPVKASATPEKKK
ncbi:MAG: preprotein translocase subunit SecG [Candidatus Firestonebacteria bacterium]